MKKPCCNLFYLSFLWGACYPALVFPPEDTEVCGNGLLEVGEACDDENAANNDGCSSTCQLEADLFVLCDGTAGGDGSLEDPFRVLSEAILAAGDNDVVMILPKSPQACGSAGVISRPLVLQGLAAPDDPAAPARPIIDAGASPAIDVSLDAAGVVVIRDLDIRANFAGAAIRTARSSQTALLRLDVQNASIDPEASAIDCNNESAEGVTLIDQSVVRDSPQGGVRIRGESQVVIANSLFKSNGSLDNGGSLRGAIEVESDTARVDVLYSTFDDNHANDHTGLDLQVSGQAKLFSSITHNTNTNTANFVDALSVNSIVTIVTFSNTFQEVGPPVGNENIDEDPQFVSQGEGIAADYHLSTAGTLSPCIDAGGTSDEIELFFDPLAVFGVDVFTHDFLGNPRPLGAPDMGMFEEQ